MPTQQSALPKILSSAGVSNVLGEKFLPDESIKSLITPTSVNHHLSICFKGGWANKRVQERVHASSDQTFLNMITSSAIKVFAVLVLCQKEHYVFELLKQGIDDHCLPFTDCSNFPHGLSDTDCILRTQWQVLAQVFTQGVDYDLPEGSVLPFVSEESLGKEVDKVCIHPGYMQISASSLEPPSTFTGNVVACKRIRLHGIPESDVWALNDAFRRESTTLKHLLAARLHHRHIIELFAIYTMGGDYFILESCGDSSLDQVFQMAQAPPSFGDSEEAVQSILWGSLRHLASALDYLHNTLDVAINHHDIKPANIIIKDAILQIVDFGLSGLKSRDDTKTDYHGGTYSYSPPEYYVTESPKNRFGRGVDVWSLGCVFSEIATLAIYGFGSGGVSRFKLCRQNGPNSHRYPNSGPDASFHNNMVEVRTWLRSLHLKVPHSDRGRAIECISEMLTIDPEYRPPLSKIYTQFQALFD